MNIEQCKAEITRHEGKVLEIYEDSLGYKTLGIGHLCQPEDPEYKWEVGTKVSEEVVNMYFEDDFEKHLTELLEEIHGPIPSLALGDHSHGEEDGPGRHQQHVQHQQPVEPAFPQRFCWGTHGKRALMAAAIL